VSVTGRRWTLPYTRDRRKLGRGARGTVYLCSHVLESQTLGFYAAKIVSVGDSTRSLVATLQEVKHLEQLRHANIIAYHHAWLEMHSENDFQPEVPHLFLLMSFANGGRSVAPVVVLLADGMQP
jgi:serine/threonine protein kinase